MWCYCLGPLGLSPPGDALKHCAECDSDLSLWGVRSLGVNTTFIIQCVSVASLTCSWVFNTWRCLLPQFSSVTQSCPTLCDAMDCSMPGFPLHHQLLELLKLMSIKSVMPSNHLILCCPLLLLPSIIPSIRVFSSESVLHIRWLKCWSFSFSISLSNEYSGLISFRMDWLDLLAVQAILKSLL